MADETQYWFPAKRYGWGWGPPRRWEGWLVLAIWTGAVAAAAIHWMPYRVPAFLGFNGAMVVVLILICYWKGEPPRWRWGE